MPDALTEAQFEVLRRVRDCLPLSAAPYVEGSIREVGFLLSLHLLRIRGPGKLELTDLGEKYLDLAARGSTESGAPAEGSSVPTE